MNTLAQLVEVEQGGYSLLLFPWEVAEVVVAEADAVLAEQEAKPGLGLWDVADESEFDEGAFMHATLDAMRATGRAAAHVGGAGYARLSPEAQAACDAEQAAMRDDVHAFEDWIGLEQFENRGAW